MTRQRYVSDELTHFIGRGLLAKVPDQSEREDRIYDLLLRILRGGRLQAKPEVLIAEGSSWQDAREGAADARHVSWDRSRDLSEMFEPTVVCFCDIPLQDLGIHMSKYSRFGIAFTREFLLAHGANPVLYLAYDAVDADGAANKESFSEGAQVTFNHVNELMTAGTTEEWELGLKLTSFLAVRLFPLIKPFHGSLADEDPENYYMEREWRIYGSLNFALENVRRVYLPERFAKTFRDDLPEYFGQVTFAH